MYRNIPTFSLQAAQHKHQLAEFHSTSQVPHQTIPPGLDTKAAQKPAQLLVIDSIIPPYEPPAVEEIKDVDSLFKHNPDFSTDYVNDVYMHLRDLESNGLFTASDYIEKQQKMKEVDREKCIDLAVELHFILKKLNCTLQLDTIFLAVNYFDRFLSTRTVSREKLVILMISCFYVASKFEDSNYPLMTDLVQLSHNAASKGDIQLLERIILQKLNFRLGAPTVYSFLRRYVHVSECTNMVGLTARFLSEVSLMSYSLSVQYPPSMVAAAALAHALRLNDLPPWTRTLEYYSGYKFNDLRECMLEMRELVKRVPQMKYQTSFKKYSSENYLRIAAITVEKM